MPEKDRLYLIVDSEGRPVKNGQGRLRIYRSLEQLLDYFYIFEDEYVKVYELTEVIKANELEDK